MKTINILFLCMFYVTAFAQTYQVEQTSERRDGDLRECLKVTLSIPEGRMVSNELRSYLIQNYGIRLSRFGWRNRDAEEVVFSKISDKEISLYAVFERTREETVFNLFLMQQEEYLSFSKHKAQWDSLEVVVNSFLKNVMTKYYDEELKQINREISKLDKSLSKARRQLEKNEKSLAKNEERITKLSRENTRLREDNEDLNKTIREKESSSAERSSELFKKREALERTKRSLLQN